MIVKRLSIIISFLLITIGIYLFFFGTPWKHIEMKEQFQVYLEDKYGTEFKVKNIDFDFMHRTYIAEVHPVSDPNLYFRAWQDIQDKELYDLYKEELEKHNNAKK